MGLKSKLNKMKSFLFDDEEEENIKKPKVSLKKENQKEIENEEEKKISKTQDMEELYFEDVSEVKEELNEIKSRTQKNEAEFKFPQFDDEDFAVSKVRPEPLFEKEIRREEPKKPLYQGSKRKEETKKFKPSPIISPIYGLLDSDGNTIKEEDKVKEKNKYEEVSLDSVRKKAYGIDEEIEDTMKRLSKKTIEEAEKDMEKEEKELSREKSKKVIEKENIFVKDDSDDSVDDMILPNVNFKEIDVDKEREKLKDIKNSNKDIIRKDNFDDDSDDDDDTKEQDLFNLIDSMYQKEGSEE